MITIIFRNLPEDRTSAPIEVEWTTITYAEILAGVKDAPEHIAEFRDGLWVTNDGLTWTDVDFDCAEARP